MWWSANGYFKKKGHEKAGQVSLSGFSLAMATLGERWRTIYIMPPIPPMPWS